MCLGIQIITGILLAMHYTAHVDLAFLSVDKIHGGKKDSNIWKETSQKQKAGLEKEGALKKGSGRSWFKSLKGQANETSSSWRDCCAPWGFLTWTCVVDLALRVSVSLGLGRIAGGLVACLRVCETLRQDPCLN
jgi:hypothetical protein